MALSFPIQSARFSLGTCPSKDQFEDYFQKEKFSYFLSIIHFLCFFIFKKYLLIYCVCACACDMGEGLHGPGRGQRRKRPSVILYLCVCVHMCT